MSRLKGCKVNTCMTIMDPASAISKLPILHNFTKREASEMCNSKIKIPPLLFMANKTEKES